MKLSANALASDEVKSHYTGIVVVYDGDGANLRDYGTKRLKILDVVDGQQRLTTSCLFLAVVIRALLNKGESAYERDIEEFLYSGAICKLTLNNNTGDLFYDLLKAGHANTPAQSPHEKRLVAAYERLRVHIDNQLILRRGGGIAYLRDLHHAVTQKLNFTYYAMEEECEIGMTFELVNSRGKGLSVLELLKNYLMHWVSRNGEPAEKRTLTALININWKDTYTNLGLCAGDEDQCLRIAWTLYYNHTPANWVGYDGFKADDYIPLRNFSSTRTKPQTKEFITRFADGLAEISRHYATITEPSPRNTLSADELLWLTKIHHTGNIANFLPLMVATRKHRESGRISEQDYISLLKALECFAYRVFLFNGRRSNAGKSSFYRWASEIFTQAMSLRVVTAWVHDLIRYYAPEESFQTNTTNPGNWYGTRNRLKYTLFEYELHLLENEGHDKQPLLRWEQLNDSTIEHILPQNPDEASYWKAVCKADEIKSCLHDIAKLVLTKDNSSYNNFEFSRKKGIPGKSSSYSNSDIRQERKISSFLDWTPVEFNKRRSDLVAWLSDRWKTEGGSVATPLEVADEADEDGTAAQAERVSS